MSQIARLSIVLTTSFLLAALPARANQLQDDCQRLLEGPSTGHFGTPDLGFVAVDFEARAIGELRAGGKYSGAAAKKISVWALGFIEDILIRQGLRSHVLMVGSARIGPERVEVLKLIDRGASPTDMNLFFQDWQKLDANPLAWWNLRDETYLTHLFLAGEKSPTLTLWVEEEVYDQVMRVLLIEAMQINFDISERPNSGGDAGFRGGGGPPITF